MATRGRPPARDYSVPEVASLASVPLAVIERHLTELTRPSFFPGARLEAGEWIIPESDVRLFLGRKVQACFKLREAAGILSVSYDFLWTKVREGLVPTVRVFGETRITEAALMALQRPNKEVRL